MLHQHELSRAVQADRERDMRTHAPRVGGLTSGSRHPGMPDSGIVEPGLRRIVLRTEPKPAFGA